jgi:hypothetical protein
MRNLLPLLLLTACTSAVRREFDATLAEATAPPPALEANWQPDASLRIAPTVVESALTAALSAADLSTSLTALGVTLQPRLGVERLRLADADPSCPSCIRLGGTLAGVVGYSALGFSGSTGVRVTLVLDTALEARREPDGWSVYARSPELKKVRTEIPLVNTRIADLLITPIVGWISGAVADSIQPIRVARLGELEAPLQAVTVAVRDQIVEVRARTTSLWRDGVAPAPDPGAGWTARVSLGSVVEAARRASFEAGSVGFGVWAEPRRLQFEDDTFTLDLRVWRVSGFGWWRDYRIEGRTSWVDQNLVLTADQATEVAQSTGAGLVDPIAALLESKILKVMAAAVSTSLPSSRTEDVGGVRVTWGLTKLESVGGDLMVYGTASFDAVSP